MSLYEDVEVRGFRNIVLVLDWVMFRIVIVAGQLSLITLFYDNFIKGNLRIH